MYMYHPYVRAYGHARVRVRRVRPTRMYMYRTRYTCYVSSYSYAPTDTPMYCST